MRMAQFASVMLVSFFIFEIWKTIQRYQIPIIEQGPISNLVQSVYIRTYARTPARTRAHMHARTHKHTYTHTHILTYILRSVYVSGAPDTRVMHCGKKSQDVLHWSDNTREAFRVAQNTLSALEAGHCMSRTCFSGLCQDRIVSSISWVFSCLFVLYVR